MRSSRLSFGFVLGTVAASLALAFAGCSLGLDESLIGRRGDGGANADGRSFVDGDIPGSDGSTGPNGLGGPCEKNEDCTGVRGCFTSTCDRSRGTCVVNVCRGTCTSATCNVGPGICATAPRTFGFRATEFQVDGAIGCGTGSITPCFTAVYPFVFIGTTTGVLVYSAAEPPNPQPVKVPIVGLDFNPSRILASGNRVFFLGTPTAMDGGARVPIAWADVPADPFAPRIQATSVIASYNRPANEPLKLFARADSTALLVDDAPASQYATAILAPPLAAPLALAMNPITAPGATVPFAGSGTRLVLAQNSVAAIPSFHFVNGAGTGMPLTTAETVVNSAAPAAPPGFTAESSDGAVFWSFISLTSAPPGPPTPAIRAVKGFFLVPNAGANFDPNGGVDLELYGTAPIGTPTVGPVAMLDANTAIVTTSVPGTPAQTFVQFVTRQPLAVIKNADNSPRRSLIPRNVDSLAAAGSNGLGYVLASFAVGPPIVYVFDPACGPP